MDRTMDELKEEKMQISQNTTGLVLPEPVGTVIPLTILVLVVVYLITDIIRNGDKWKK